MKKWLLLIIFLIICSFCLSFAGCAGGRDVRRDGTTIEDDYKSDRDISREMDRDRLDHGGY
jgi:predicted small secreted protein